jgi:hypothetical protein
MPVPLLSLSIKSTRASRRQPRAQCGSANSGSSRTASGATVRSSTRSSVATRCRSALSCQPVSSSSHWTLLYPLRAPCADGLLRSEAVILYPRDAANQAAVICLIIRGGRENKGARTHRLSRRCLSALAVSSERSSSQTCCCNRTSASSRDRRSLQPASRSAPRADQRAHTTGAPLLLAQLALQRLGPVTLHSRTLLQLRPLHLNPTVSSEQSRTTQAAPSDAAAGWRSHARPRPPHASPPVAASGSAPPAGCRTRSSVRPSGTRPGGPHILLADSR